MATSFADRVLRTVALLLFVCSYLFFAAAYFLPAPLQDPASVTAPPVNLSTAGYLNRYELGETPSTHVEKSTITIDDDDVCFTLTDAFKTGTKPGTYSMIPTVNNHTTVIYERPTRENVRVGDIIIFRSSTTPNGTIIHRVTAITNGTYITRGDNNKNIDHHAVQFTDILGVVAAIIY